ncbi:MAG: dTMP kinase [Thermoleophilaceae bacterium]|nr:dTMP kinase [Thermoleophilaceae bacterium]
MTDGGYFISFEGIDRSGKSTQAIVLAEELGERALFVREPGGTIFSERVRGILKDPEVPLSPRAEALLFAAARADLVASVIRPALDEGRIVIADRFIDSSLAYQGVARGLGVDAIKTLNHWAADTLMPNMTLLIEIDPAVAISRGAEEHDRFEDEGESFQRKVAEAYDQLAIDNPDRIIRVDGDRGPDDVALDVREIVFDRLGLTLA